MRFPVTSEREVFLTVYAVTFVVAVSALVGYLAGPAAGFALLAAAAAFGFGWTLRRTDRASPVHDAEQAGHTRPGNERRVLVVAGEALVDDDLWQKLFARRPRAPTVEVLAPVLQSRTHFVTTDIDRETEQAHRRLDETLASARRHGLDATGQVGDAIDPLATLVDELSRYDVDEVVLATHGPSHPNWVESDMLDQLREQLGVPLTQVVIERDAKRVTVSAAPAREANE